MVRAAALSYDAAIHSGNKASRKLSERELSASLSVVAAAAGLEAIQTYLSDSDTVAIFPRLYCRSCSSSTRKSDPEERKRHIQSGDPV